MKKRKSVRETIEETDNPYVEHRFIKYPGKEPVEVTDYERATSTNDSTDVDKYHRAIEKGNYTDIHTHPTFLDTTKNYPLPSGGDLESFLKTKMRSMVIAVRKASYSGEVIGYTVIRKTKQTPRRGSKNYKQYFEDLKEYEKQTKLYAEKEPEKIATVFDKFAKKYHIRHRLVPIEGYKVNDSGSAFVKKGGLEKRLGLIVVFVGLALGIFFFPPTFTGNTLFNLGDQSYLGIGIIVVLGIFVFLFFRLRKK